MIMKLTLSSRAFAIVLIVFALMLAGKCFRLPAEAPVAVGGGQCNTGNLNQEVSQASASESEGNVEVFPTGSNLPDCSHACGACFPCKRVMVSFKCSVAESCPIVYRCMCKGKYYHVPSN